MFKFFREYNKYILVVGGSILMIAFLIEPALDVFRYSPGDTVVGTLDGREITLEDQYFAGGELAALQRIPLLGIRTPQDPLAWYLLVEEARALGLSASDVEVQQILQMLEVDERAMAQLIQMTGGTRGLIEQAVRHWLMVQAAQELAVGKAHVDVEQRLSSLAAAQQFAFGGLFEYAEMFLESAGGIHRVSEPLVRHFLQSQEATVAGQAAVISYERYLPRIADPSEAELQELFEAHRNDLPGGSEPYGLGYTTPDQVRIEWLTVPLEAVRNSVQIDEADALQHYQQNRDQFRTPGADGTQQVPPYVEVRDRVIEQLRRQRAEERAQQIVRAAQNVMREDPAARRLPQEGAYRAVPADFQPITLDEVAQVVQERFNVPVRVQRRTDRWLTREDLDNLPELGGATLATRQDVELAPYVLSAREMVPSADNPLTPLRLQVGLPSEPMRSWDGYHVFRLVAAEPARAPESLNEIRDQVARDARRLAAYRLLQQEMEDLVAQARETGVEAFSASVQARLVPVSPVARRSMAAPTREVEVPGIGPADGLLAAMFQVGQSLHDQGAIQDLPEAQRIGAADLPRQLSVAVFRLDAFQPMTQGDYRSALASQMLSPALNRNLLRQAEQDNPLSLEAVQKRVGFVPSRDDG